MLELPENRVFKTLMVASTVAVVFCYAWLTARMLEPSFSVSSEVVSSVFLREDDEIKFFEDQASRFPVAASRLSEATSSLAERLSLLESFETPLRIVVDADHGDRLVVGNDRIEIGVRVLQTRGQLKKAILKSWLLQRVSPEIAGSYLRIEVASDVLLAVLEGGLKLDDPLNGKGLSLDVEERPWWSYVNSYQGVCRSPWRSVELMGLCHENQETVGHARAKDSESPGDVVSALSFRPFLASQIWRSYLRTSPRDRMKFVKDWIRVLSVTSDTVSATSISRAAAGPAISLWVSQLSEDLETLLPSSMDSLAEERAGWNKPIHLPLVVFDQKGRATAPGSLQIPADEIRIESAKMAVLTQCQSPTLAKILNLTVKADRVVWRPECETRATDFIQVRPSSIRLAISRGLARPADRLDEFVMKNHDTDALGLKEAAWDPVKQAFRVNGAIEAVEWYRLSGKPI